MQDKRFYRLIETSPDYGEYQSKPYSVHKDSVWRNDRYKNRVNLVQINF